MEHTKTEINSLAMQTGKVMYIHGALGGSMNIGDMDEEYYVCEHIAKEWNNKIDIQSEDEEGYIQEYARRKLEEIYNTKVAYISVWNGGRYELSSNAKYDKSTGEVFDIESTEFNVELLNSLDYAFIRLNNGEELKVEKVGYKYFVEK